MEQAHLEPWIIVIGCIGLLIALLAIVFRKPRRHSELNIPAAPTKAAPAALPAETAASSWWAALAKTRARFLLGFSNTEVGALRDAMEEACIVSDLGVTNTTEALQHLDWTAIAETPAGERAGVAKNKLSSVIRGWVASADGLAAQDWPQMQGSPTVIWFVGVNGVGKTTSIAKLAGELKARGHSVMLAAGDTFRAAATEQLETWAERLAIPCVKGQLGADSSAVLFDAIQSAKAKRVDFLLCDSAGRLHNQLQLMEALGKNKRVMNKALEGAPHEVLLVLDANTGQNMVLQAEQFLSSVGVTGLVLTKLDGTAKGGAVVAVARRTSLPIRRLGLGEGIKDFTAFEAAPFSDALLGVGNLKS